MSCFCRPFSGRPVAMRGRRERGFTLVELLVTMAITTVILGSVMMAMTDAIEATESASQIANLNNGLRTAMDLMVRDILQAGQGLPGGRSILIPSGAGAQLVQLPGPIGSAFTLDGPSFCPPAPPDDVDTVCEQIQAIIPGPNRGPVMVADQPASDMITMLAADSSFDSVPLRAFTADGRSITVAQPGAVAPLHPSGRNIADDPDVDGDNLRAGDLIMLTKGPASALVMVSRVNGQQVFFEDGDALMLNQMAAADGTAVALRNTAPVDALTRPPCAAAPAPCDFISSVATRIRMITYYLDNTTSPARPRLVRRMNNSMDPVKWSTYDNNDGAVVAFDIEDLQITYDLVDGVNNPSNVRMDDDDYTVAGRCDPSPCYPSQIRKVNILLAGRSRMPRRGTDQFYRNRLVTQVSLRSLAFVDKYR